VPAVPIDVALAPAMPLVPATPPVATVDPPVPTLAVETPAVGPDIAPVIVPALLLQALQSDTNASVAVRPRNPLGFHMANTPREVS
jgi:hypothetical protein